MCSELIDKYSPAVFCIQETKLKNCQEQTFKNYHAYYNCTESGGGGVAILVKDNVPHSQISLSTKIQAVAVRIDIDGKAYSVCSIYIPPDNTVNISIKDLKDLIWRKTLGGAHDTPPVASQKIFKNVALPIAD